LRDLVAIVTFLAAVGLPSCGGDGDQSDCVSICEDAQALDCTAVTGDCGQFCQALFNVEGPAGCGDERRTYQDCLGGEATCSGACGDSENALSSCVGGYCASHLGDADCQVLLTSF